MSKKLAQRERVTRTLAAYVLKEGLSATSIRQLAGAADISDRMLLYYFEDKADVLTTVLAAISADLAALLDKTLPEGETFSPQELFDKAAKLTGGKALAPYMHIAVELAAAAARNEEPFKTISEQIASGFIAWTQHRLAAKRGRDNKAQAAMILAMIDGLAVLRSSASKSVVAGATKQMSASLANA